MSVKSSELTTKTCNRSVRPHEKPSLLAVTSQLPWPLTSGGHLRTFHLLRALARTYRVRLVTTVTTGQEAEIDCLHQYGISVCPALVKQRVGWREALRAGVAVARREPYVLYRRHDRAAVRSALKAEFDKEPPGVVYLDHLDSLIYRSLAGQTPCLIDLHNVYSSLVAREAREQKSWLVRQYLHRESRLLARMEKRAAKGIDALLTVSEEDRQHFVRLGAQKVNVVPNGVDCSAYASLPTGRTSGRPTILYVGVQSWAPNAKAAFYLATNVLPQVRERFPSARVQIIGRDPPRELQALNGSPGVEILGNVPDIKPYLEKADVLAVPLESGGGTRLKILEAFASGLPTVSTPVGCEGLRAVHGEHLMIAAREDFAASILALLDDTQLGTRLAQRARELAKQYYDWSKVGDLATTALAQLVGIERCTIDSSV
jgi:glycosyltransferase involved in cell wall biosynthesis